MRVETDNRTMTWTLDRPGQSNGLDEPTMAQMETALDTLEAPDSGFACLCITGDETVFSTGLDADLLEVCFRDRDRFAAVVRRSDKVFGRIAALPLVTIACLDGECRLGGLELALACDIIVAGEGARISDGHMAYDAMPGAGGTKRLPRRIGYAAALRFILEAPVLEAGKAAELGLVDEVAPAGKSHQRGAEIAAEVAGHDPTLVRDIKACLRAASPVSNDRSYHDAFQRSVIDRLVGS